MFFFFQAEVGIRAPLWSRGLGDVYQGQLSTYARQFLSMMEKPDIDHIEGLSPAISIAASYTHLTLPTIPIV